MNKYLTTALFLATASSIVATADVQAEKLHNNEVQTTSETIFKSPFYQPPLLETHERISNVLATSEATATFTDMDSFVDYVVDNIRELNTSFKVRFEGDATSLIKNKQITPLIRAVLDQDDYLTGIGASSGYRVSYTSTYADFEFEASYFITKEEQAFVDREVKRIVSEIIRPNMTDAEKVLAINEYIVKNTTYTKASATTPHASYALFKEGKGVCQAYAMAAYHLLLEAGLDVHYVTGWAGEGHAWNLVKVDGEWFHLDTTWNDPTFKQSFEGMEDFISYKYLFVSDAVLLANRTMDERPGLPKATSERFAALQSVKSVPFTFNSVPYLLLPEINNNELYYVSSDDRSYAIEVVNLADQTPTVQRFANVRAMDILVTDDAVYFVNIDKQLGLSKIDKQSKAVTHLYTDDVVTSIKLNGNEVQAYHDDQIVFTEKVQSPITSDVQKMIEDIDALRHNSETFLVHIEQITARWDRLTTDEQALVTNQEQLFYLQSVAEDYHNQIQTITNAIAQLNKATALDVLVSDIAAISTMLEEAPSVVLANINNIDSLYTIESFVEEQLAVQQDLQALIDETTQRIHAITYLHKDFAAQAEQLSAVFPTIKEHLSADTVQKFNDIQAKYKQLKNLAFTQTSALANTQTTSNERKPWSVTLSTVVKNNAANLEKIKVVDMFGDPIDVAVKINGKKITITPQQSYAPEIPYTLLIEEGLTNTSNRALKQGVHLQFYFLP